MNSIFIISLAVCFVMVVWFKTKAIYEYIKVLNISPKFIKEFEEEDFDSLPEYLIAKNSKNFWFKLLSCHYCLSFWISLLFCVLTFNLFNVFAVAFLSIFLYSLLEKIES